MVTKKEKKRQMIVLRFRHIWRITLLVVFLLSFTMSFAQQDAIIINEYDDYLTTNTSFRVQCSVDNSNSVLDEGDDYPHYFEVIVSDDFGNSWFHIIPTNRAYHVSGLNPDVDTYYYKIRGVNNHSGATEWTSLQEVVMKNDVEKMGDYVYGMDVSSVGQTSFRLSWKNPFYDDVPWEIDVTLDPFFERIAEGYEHFVYTGSDNTTLLEGLVPGNTYYIRITREGLATYSMTLKVIMKPASPNVYKMSVTKDSFIGIWDEVNGATNYEVTLDDGDGFHKTYNTTETEYFFQGLPSGVELLVDVTAKNSSGSAKSEAITVDLIGGD